MTMRRPSAADIAPGAARRWPWGRLAVFAALCLSVATIAWIYDVTLARGVGGAEAIDPDDIMRRLTVRELLAGQDWFDNRFWRVGEPATGVSSHWSRLVDLPLAVAIRLLTPLLGMADAERVTLLAMPLVVLAITMILLLRVVARLAIVWPRPWARRGQAVAVLLLLPMLPAALIHTMPWRIDHHGWQSVAALAMVLALLRRPGLRAGASAGLAGAVALILSFEGVPLVAAAVALGAWRWTSAPRAARPTPSRDAEARQLTGLVAALLLLPPLLVVATRGLGGLVATHCDSWTGPYLAAALCGGGLTLVGIGLADRLARTGRWTGARLMLVRAGVLGVAAAATGMSFARVAPACLDGPFGALPPLVQRYWYDQIHEGLPIWRQPGTHGLSLGVVLACGLAATGAAWWSARSAARRADATGGTGARVAARRWATMVWMGAAAALAGLLVARANGVAQLLLAPGLAWALVRGATGFATADAPLRRWGSALMLIAALPAVMVPMTRALSARAGLVVASAAPVPQRCDEPAGVRAVSRALDRPVDPDGPEAIETLAVDQDYAPLFLIETRHRVVATGHHRGAAGLERMIALMLASPDEAAARLRAMGARHLILCRGGPIQRLLAREAPGGLAALVQRGGVPPGLRRVQGTEASAFIVLRRADAP